LAQWICNATLALIDGADCVMANLNPFRGLEPDPGTVFEAAYARATSKPGWVYKDEARPPGEQAGVTDRDGHVVDAQGYTVENFGMNLNLMIACTAQIVHGDAQTCLQTMAMMALRDHEVQLGRPGQTQRGGA